MLEKLTKKRKELEESIATFYEMVERAEAKLEVVNELIKEEEMAVEAAPSECLPVEVETEAKENPATVTFTR